MNDKFDINQYVKSTAEEMVDKQAITTDNIIFKFGFAATKAKRYVGKLTEYGYLEAHGGNRNRSCSLIRQNDI